MTQFTQQPNELALKSHLFCSTSKIRFPEGQISRICARVAKTSPPDLQGKKLGITGASLDSAVAVIENSGTPREAIPLLVVDRRQATHRSLSLSQSVTLRLMIATTGGDRALRTLTAFCASSIIKVSRSRPRLRSNVVIPGR